MLAAVASSALVILSSLLLTAPARTLDFTFFAAVKAAVRGAAELAGSEAAGSAAKAKAKYPFCNSASFASMASARCR
jgi:hypothetical protein